MFTQRVRAALVLACATVGLAVPASAAPKPSQPSPGFTLFATHPLASKIGWKVASGTRCVKAGTTSRFEFRDDDGDGVCPVGGLLTDMAVNAEGSLVAGYGDWNRNIDSTGNTPVAVVPLSLTTGTWGETYLSGTESMDVIRKDAQGRFLIPTTDPSLRKAHGADRANLSGMLVGASATDWSFMSNGLGVEHVFDVADLDGALYQFGSGTSTDSRATIAQSTDAGATWVYVSEQRGDVVLGNERFYWGRPVRGKVWSSATLGYAATERLATGGMTSVRPGEAAFVSTDPGRVVTFDAKRTESYRSSLISQSLDQLSPQVFDGKAWATKPFPDGTPARDFNIGDDGLLYALTANWNVYRLGSVGQPWTLVQSFAAPDDPTFTASTLAVFRGQVYVGGSGGRIYSATMTGTPVASTTFHSERDCAIASSACVTSMTPGTVKLGQGKVTVTLTGAHLDEAFLYLLQFVDNAGSYRSLPVSDQTSNSANKASFVVDTSDPDLLAAKLKSPVFGKLMAWASTGGYSGDAYTVTR